MAFLSEGTPPTTPIDVLVVAIHRGEARLYSCSAFFFVNGNVIKEIVNYFLC